MSLFRKSPVAVLPTHRWGKWELQDFFIKEQTGGWEGEAGKLAAIVVVRQIQRRECQTCGLTQEMSVDDENSVENGQAGDCIDGETHG